MTVVSVNNLLRYGDSYSGEINDEGYPQGKGVYLDIHGNSFDGEWVTNGSIEPDENNWIVGKGVIVFHDDYHSHEGGHVGIRYEGRWQWYDGNPVPHGKGKMHYANGDLFEGEMVDGWELSGTLYWANRGFYEGSFMDPDSCDLLPCDGNGIFFFGDGDYGEGQWENGGLNGQGIMEWADGSRYEGQWKDHEPHGEGVYVTESGDRAEGRFKEGLYHGRIFITKSSGIVLTQLYQNGIHVSTEPVPSWPEEKLTLELLKLKERIKRMRKSESDGDEEVG